jgi:hypothetical protein
MNNTLRGVTKALEVGAPVPPADLRLGTLPTGWAHSSSEESAMRTMRNQYGLRWAVAGICLAALIESASAGAFTRGCAARDAQVLALIEEREDAGSISSQGSSDAILALMHARMVCFEGRVLDALAIYENVGQSVTSTAIWSGRQQ